VALAIFDLDNTLLAGDSDHAWGEFLVEKGIVDAKLYKQANDQFLKDYQTGNLDIQAYLEFALQPLINQPLSKLHALREDFFETKIKPIMLSKGIDLLQSHRNNGDFILIITATNRFVTEVIAQAFKVDDLIATEPEIINDQYTGKVAGTPSFKEGKITRLNEWLKDKDHKLSGAFFYSDSHNDTPLLELVDFPVAVDPDDILRKTSEQNNWPIQSLRD
jgi:HAD superfamily hydrolase (TIGR01490 family)|tara:strand:- start:368 stop:1024 length:657 start_codon:yes stop_codon:yes gene_type:complete